ncbi:MAG: hypothetical protein PHD01_04605 [Geobacteraceae bacterium]|nr:hypothetical protein [Geobacteraceae bacterium]
MNRLETIITYHEGTKHCFEDYAKGPGRMDWATQPDLFRRYEGAPLILLEIEDKEEDPRYAALFSTENHVSQTVLNFQSVSRLLYDSMALSAWKSAGDVR